jgi:hypothetical protein
VDQGCGTTAAEGVPRDRAGGELGEKAGESTLLEWGEARLEGVPPRAEERGDGSPLDLTGGLGG